MSLYSTRPVRPESQEAFADGRRSPSFVQVDGVADDGKIDTVKPWSHRNLGFKSPPS